MKQIRNVFYVGTLVLFSTLIYWSLSQGIKQEPEIKLDTAVVSEANWWFPFISGLKDQLHHPLALLLVQIVVIILAARFLGWLCTKIRQPSVIGEMLAGILLGPTLIGSLFPEFSALIFPEHSLGNIQILSQIGLVFFMFIVGMELDLKVLKSKATDAIVISHASIIIPFSLGIALAYFVYQPFAPEGVKFLSFALFIGIAMSITAFPVLARIVQERGMHKSRLGTIVITCAAADDITAWCLLAVVIAIVKAGGIMSAFLTIGLALAYVLFMIKLVRPFLHRVGNLSTARGNVGKPFVALFFVVLLLSAFATELIGIHALFGAFMTGAIMPENNKFRSLFIEKIEDFALIVLLPLFFVYTGLRTEIGLINNGALWLCTLMIIFVAVFGKFIGSMVAARVVGQNWKNSLQIGALMNTRGLMELVVLNIGYDLGVLSPEIFAMMVVMALATTFMTGPSLHFIEKIFNKKAKLKVANDLELGTSPKEVLLVFDNPEAGEQLLKIGSILFYNDVTKYTVAHFAANEDLHLYDIGNYEQDAFARIHKTAQRQQLHLETHFASSEDTLQSLVNKAAKGSYDMVMMESGQSVYEGSALGRILGFTAQVVNLDMFKRWAGKREAAAWNALDNSAERVARRLNTNFGLFLSNEDKNVEHLVVPFSGLGDIFLLQYVKNAAQNRLSKITVVATEEAVVFKLQNLLNIGDLAHFYNKQDVISVIKLDELQYGAADLILTSLQTWDEIKERDEFWEKHFDCPRLILTQGK
jgi:Kef-type K+ transport system membrane component KefB